jgi:hypothetical protein
MIDVALKDCAKVHVVEILNYYMKTYYIWIATFKEDNFEQY